MLTKKVNGKTVSLSPEQEAAVLAERQYNIDNPRQPAGPTYEEQLTTLSDKIDDLTIKNTELTDRIVGLETKPIMEAE